MVKTIFPAFIIICINTFCMLNAGVQEELFLQANKAYEQRDFQRALQLYDQIEAKGPAVYYNMALAQHYVGKQATAIAYLHRALQQSNAQQYWRIKRTIWSLQPDNSIGDMVRNYLQFYASFLSYFYWQLLVLLFSCLSTFFLFYKKFKPYKVHVICNMLCIICLIFFGTKYQLLHTTSGIINQSAIAYAGPSEDFSDKCTIPALAHVVVLQEKDSWYKVRYDSTTGWLRAEDIVIC